MRIFENGSGDKIEVTDIPLFSVPIIITKFNDHEKYNIESFEKVVRKPKDWTCSVNTSFPRTEKDDPYISKEKCDEIKKSVTEHLQDVFECYNMPTDIKLTQFWYNAYYEGQSQELHNHLAPNNLNPFWSGIYFAKNCFPGQLTFSRNEYSMRTQQPFDFRECAIADYYNDNWKTDIPDGYICLFPPHLYHTVSVGEENRDKMRLTFSFNLHIGKAFEPDEDWGGKQLIHK